MIQGLLASRNKEYRQCFYREKLKEYVMSFFWKDYWGGTTTKKKIIRIITGKQEESILCIRM